MTQPLSRRPRPLRRFAKDTDGSVNIEALLFFPLLIGLIAVTMVFYDGFRRQSLNEKAAYTVADMLSRETSAITPGFLEGARDLAAALIEVPEGDVAVRVSEVLYNADDARYERSWSHGVGLPGLSNTVLNTRADELPPLVQGERVIFVETHVNYDWAMDVGVGETTFEAVIVMRPRFAPQLAWANN